jgi:hypothetical protein
MASDATRPIFPREFADHPAAQCERFCQSGKLRRMTIWEGYEMGL